MNDVRRRGMSEQEMYEQFIEHRWLAARDAALAAEQPATPTPSTEQIKAEALREAAHVVGHSMDYDPTAPGTERFRVVQWLKARADALVSPVSEQPTPLGPEPKDGAS